MGDNAEKKQQPDGQDHDFAGTGTTRIQFIKRAAVIVGFIFVALAFASGYYTLLNRTEPPPREPVPVELEEDAPSTSEELGRWVEAGP